jgi:hypothetical protein
LIDVVYKSIEKKKRRHKPIAANLRLKRSGSRRTEQMQIPPRAKIEVNDDAMQIIPFLLIGTYEVNCFLKITPRNKDKKAMGQCMESMIALQSRSRSGNYKNLPSS